MQQRSGGREREGRRQRREGRREREQARHPQDWTRLIKTRASRTLLRCDPIFWLSQKVFFPDIISCLCLLIVCCDLFKFEF